MESVNGRKRSSRLLLSVPCKVSAGKGQAVEEASEDENGQHTGGRGPRLPASVSATKIIADVRAVMSSAWEAGRRKGVGQLNH